MITSAQVYWLLMLDSIKGVVFGFGIVGAMLSGFLFTGTMIAFLATVGDDYNKEEHKAIGVWARWSFVPFFILLAILLSSALIPNTKQMATIMVAPKIINNEQVQELPSQVLELANDWLEELKPNKGE